MAAHIWNWWAEIAETRASSGFGLNPLTRHDIRQYADDERLVIDAWERRLILRLDAAYRKSLAPEEGEGG